MYNKLIRGVFLFRTPLFGKGEGGMLNGAKNNRRDGAPFLDKLAGYKTSKGSIQFPIDKPVDFDFIEEITKWRVKCVTEQ
jgi:hypothetical protein